MKRSATIVTSEMLTNLEMQIVSGMLITTEASINTVIMIIFIMMIALETTLGMQKVFFLTDMKLRSMIKGHKDILKTAGRRLTH